MVRSLKSRLEKLEEYAGKTEYATTDECMSLYVDCLRLTFQDNGLDINMDDYIPRKFSDVKFSDYKQAKEKIEELKRMVEESEVNSI
ncbi:hypothetical protein [Streptococcus mitis]|jgi:hypothetical protein|uniref:Uncharacterized protein n=1 Tax=Streptococcus mitis TaxID=28037 RepID=A0A1X1L1T2_STRMT|nr:hypothetical protein [Streptococcus mitis]ORP05422.1 hypothetical protein B7694_05695 [Streptococcus mitis]HET0949619.1 hypothetical protein [Streptococcus pneumoniae]